MGRKPNKSSQQQLQDALALIIQSQDLLTDARNNLSQEQKQDNNIRVTFSRAFAMLDVSALLMSSAGRVVEQKVKDTEAA
jgi:hypothetical protein